MNRLAYILIIALLCVILACSKKPSPPHSPSPAEQMAGIVARIDSLNSRIEDLKANVDRFDTENWQDVVTDVSDDADALASEIDELSSEAFELEQELIRMEDPGDDEPADDPRN